MIPGKEGRDVFSMRDHKANKNETMIIKKITNTIKKHPSPKCIFPDRSIIEKTSLPSFLKRIIRGTGKKVTAGMTVEAALVLPLFLFFFINLGSSIEMIRLHGNLQMGLWNVGNKMCVYGSMADGEGKREVSGELADVALTYSYVKNQMVAYCGKEYLDNSPLTEGAAGLQFWESRVTAQKIQTPEDTIDILMTYEVGPWLKIPYVKPFRMSNRYYGRLWTGYGIAQDGQQRSDQDMVYVTENREVYHESMECTHLKLSIQLIHMENLATARNQYDRRYTACSKCAKKGFPKNSEIYICDEGDYYHYNKNCPGLTRIISTITRQQAREENLRPCSRCGKK